MGNIIIDIDQIIGDMKESLEENIQKKALKKKQTKINGEKVAKDIQFGISESEEKKGQRAGAIFEGIMPENFIQSIELIKTKIQKLLKA